jgi:hypothetical protein
MGYKRTTKSLADIGRELRATYVIEGSIRAEGKRWRVTSKFIRVRDQVQTWSASFDSEPSSMLEFQRELSKAIAEPIRLRLSPDRLTALGRRQSRNPEAYDLYLRGRHLWNQLTPPTNRRRGTLRTRDRARPGVLARMVRTGRRLSASPINARGTSLRRDDRSLARVERRWPAA